MAVAGSLLTPYFTKFYAPIILACFFTIKFVSIMFKWRRSSKISQEPKTPRLPSIPLIPDPRYAPISFHHPYDPNLHSYPQAVPTIQAMAPILDPRYNHSEPLPTKSRSRTLSTATGVKGMLTTTFSIPF